MKGCIFCEITLGQEAVGDILFSRPEGYVVQNEWETDNLFGAVMLSVYEPDNLMDLAACAVQTCDPTIEAHDDALNLITDFVGNRNEDTEFKLNGIQYHTSYDAGLDMFGFDVFVGNS